MHSFSVSSMWNILPPNMCHKNFPPYSWDSLLPSFLIKPLINPPPPCRHVFHILCWAHQICRLLRDVPRATDALPLLLPLLLQDPRLLPRSVRVRQRRGWAIGQDEAGAAWINLSQLVSTQIISVFAQLTFRATKAKVYSRMSHAMQDSGTHHIYISVKLIRRILVTVT